MDTVIAAGYLLRHTRSLRHGEIPLAEFLANDCRTWLTEVYSPCSFLKLAFDLFFVKYIFKFIAELTLVATPTIDSLFTWTPKVVIGLTRDLLSI